MSPAGEDERLGRLLAELLSAYGPQHWWPAETPFEVMVGAVLTQNTAWTNVERAIANLRETGVLDPVTLAGMSPGELAPLLRPAGYFNVKTARLQAFCRWLVAQGGVEALAPRDTAALRADLLAVKGVGPETADDMLLYALHRPVFVVDAYTRRIFARLGLATGDEPYEALRGAVESALGPDAPALNELHALLVVHAKERCRARAPRCGGCPLAPGCGYPGA